MKIAKIVIVIVVMVTILLELGCKAGVKSHPEAGVKSEPSAGSYLNLTPEENETFRRIISKSDFMHNKIDVFKGLGAIKVLVEKLEPEIEQLGLTKQELQIDIELLLRKYDIPVAKDAYFDGCFLYAQVRVVPTDMGIVIFNISIELREDMMLIKHPSTMIINSVLWDTGSTGGVGKEKIDSIRGEVENYVKKFINKYLEANPNT